MSKFKIGDVVALKSGGPLMTVQAIGDYLAIQSKDALNCAWFDDRKLVEAIFHPDSVELHKENSC